jgi:hypothetical protein
MIGFTNKYLLPIVPPKDTRSVHSNLYYGREADDPMVRLRFNSKVNPMGVKLKATMSSDIEHWGDDRLERGGRGSS